jgi:hypothetical protein
MGLREVLDAFEQNEVSSLAQLSHKLNIEPGMLDIMIQFWVRKGKIREICSSGTGCAGCKHHNDCFSSTITIPRRYELVRDPAPEHFH